MKRPLSQRFQMTYKRCEAPVYIPMEEQLMKQIGCTRCDLHKVAIRRLNNEYVMRKSDLVLV